MLILSKYSLITTNNVMLGEEVLVKNEEGKNGPDFLKDAYYKLGLEYLKFFKMDNLSKLGFLASEMLLGNEAEIPFDNSLTGIILMNAASSLDTDLRFAASIKPEAYFPSPAVFVYTLPNIVIGEICIRHKITGPNVFFVQETFEPEFCLTFVNETFAKSAIERALVGWTEFDTDHFVALMMLVTRGEKGSEFNLTNLENLKGILNTTSNE